MENILETISADVNLIIWKRKIKLVNNEMMQSTEINWINILGEEYYFT